MNASYGHSDCVQLLQTIYRVGLRSLNSPSILPRKAGGMQSFVMSMNVDLSVCLSARITRKPSGRTSPIFVSVAYGRGSIGPLTLMALGYVVYCTSGSVDNVHVFGRPYYRSSLWYSMSSVCLSVCL